VIKKKILIVDDEIEMAEMETMRLKASGYEVMVAHDGKSGLQKARQWQPDLVILDLMLPVMNGYEVCAALKKDEQCRKIPIILVSAVDHKYDTDLGKKVGAEAYFTKPFEPAILLNSIKALMRKKQ
jgi:DNA-binding response OmpR family regulator